MVCGSNPSQHYLYSYYKSAKKEEKKETSKYINLPTDPESTPSGSMKGEGGGGLDCYGENRKYIITMQI